MAANLKEHKIEIVDDISESWLCLTADYCAHDIHVRQMMTAFFGHGSVMTKLKLSYVWRDSCAHYIHVRKISVLFDRGSVRTELKLSHVWRGDCVYNIHVREDDSTL